MNNSSLKSPGRWGFQRESNRQWRERHKTSVCAHHCTGSRRGFEKRSGPLHSATSSWYAVLSCSSYWSKLEGWLGNQSKLLGWCHYTSKIDALDRTAWEAAAAHPFRRIAGNYVAKAHSYKDCKHKIEAHNLYSTKNQKSTSNSTWDTDSKKFHALIFLKHCHFPDVFNIKSNSCNSNDVGKRLNSHTWRMCSCIPYITSDCAKKEQSAQALRRLTITILQHLWTTT